MEVVFRLAQCLCTSRHNNYNMAVVLVTGVRESDKETVMELVKKITTLPDFALVDFEDVITSDKKLLADFAAVGAFDSLTKLKSWGLRPEEKSYQTVMRGVARFYTLLHQQLKEAQAGSRNVLASGMCALDTQYGQVPLLSHELLSFFRPDVILLVESDVASRFRLFDEDYEVFLRDESRMVEARELVIRQAQARAYVNAFAALYGGMVKTIIVRKGKAKYALQETLETLQFVFKE